MRDGHSLPAEAGSHTLPLKRRLGGFNKHFVASGFSRKAA